MKKNDNNLNWDQSFCNMARHLSVFLPNECWSTMNKVGIVWINSVENNLAGNDLEQSASASTSWYHQDGVHGRTDWKI